MYYLMNKNEKIAKTAFEGGLHGRHLFYRTMLNAYMIPIGDIRKVQTQTGLLNAGVSIEIKDGTKIRLPYAVEPDEFTYGGTYYREHGPRIGDNWVNIAVAC